MIASAWTVASEHILSFGLGVVGGFIGSSRYRLVKRSDSSPASDDDITRR